MRIMSALHTGYVCSSCILGEIQVSREKVCLYHLGRGEVQISRERQKNVSVLMLEKK